VNKTKSQAAVREDKQSKHVCDTSDSRRVKEVKSGKEEESAGEEMLF
jgi:hypothetical protein